MRVLVTIKGEVTVMTKVASTRMVVMGCRRPLTLVTLINIM